MTIYDVDHMTLFKKAFFQGGIFSYLLYCKHQISFLLEQNLGVHFHLSLSLSLAGIIMAINYANDHILQMLTFSWSLRTQEILGNLTSQKSKNFWAQG